MIVPALDKSKAKAWLEAKREGREPVEDYHESGVLPRGNAREVIEAAKLELRRLANALEDESDRLRVRKFDADGSAILHDALSDLPLRVADDRDFWRYLACGPLYELVLWRYPDTTNLKRFAISGQFESVPEQLWFRGHVVHDPNREDPYTLARRGGVDFWVSGNIRHLFGAIPAVARAVVEFQYPEDGAFDDAGNYTPRSLTLDGFRELFKRIRHYTAVNELATLGEDTATELVRTIGSSLLSMHGTT